MLDQFSRLFFKLLYSVSHSLRDDVVFSNSSNVELEKLEADVKEEDDVIFNPFFEEIEEKLQS